MGGLLIQRRYSGYSNSRGETNIPIERKRAIAEDASWYDNKTEKTSDYLQEQQIEDIFYEHKKKNIPITRNDAIRKTIGEPTNPIVEALLHAEYQYKVNDAIIDVHKRMGWIEWAISSSTYSDFNRNAVGLVRRKPLERMNNEELLKNMFAPFKLFAKDYCTRLEKQFRINDGETLEWTFEKWPDREVTNLDNLLNAIKDKIYVAYRKGFPENITPEIQANMIDFSDFHILPEFMAFGGVQEVELKGYLVKVKRAGKGDYFNKSKKHDPTVLEIRLEFVIKDWFGVDEEDIYKNSLATQIGREYLAAFWVLQHRRDYQPFINVIYYKETKDYVF